MSLKLILSATITHSKPCFPTDITFNVAAAINCNILAFVHFRKPRINKKKLKNLYKLLPTAGTHTEAHTHRIQSSVWDRHVQKIIFTPLTYEISLYNCNSSWDERTVGQLGSWGTGKLLTAFSIAIATPQSHSAVARVLCPSHIDLYKYIKSQITIFRCLKCANGRHTF